jgi:hypothetical protein
MNLIVTVSLDLVGQGAALVRGRQRAHQCFIPSAQGHGGMGFSTQNDAGDGGVLTRGQNTAEDGVTVAHGDGFLFSKLSDGEGGTLVVLQLRGSFLQWRCSSGKLLRWSVWRGKIRGSLATMAVCEGGTDTF